MVGVACAPVVALPEEPVDPDALAACVDDVLARIAAAASPVLMVGVEVRRFRLEEKVALLAGRLGLPVVTSIMGRGLLAETATPPLGTYLGVAGAPDITARVEQSDALFLLGVIISDTNFGVSARTIDLRRTIRALDREVTLGYHTYRDIPLGAFVDALLARVPARRSLSAAPCCLRAVSARHAGRRRADRTQRYRVRGQRPHGDAWADADRGRRRRLPVHGDGHRPHGADRARVLRVDGLRRPAARRFLREVNAVAGNRRTTRRRAGRCEATGERAIRFAGVARPRRLARTPRMAETKCPRSITCSRATSIWAPAPMPIASRTAGCCWYS